MAYALDNLDSAEGMVADLSETLAGIHYGQQVQKRAKPQKRKVRSRKPKRKGPTLTGVQDEAIATVTPGQEMTVRGLFGWCREKHPGTFREEQMAAFASTFSKKVKVRDDITLIRPHKGSTPAVYLKMGATVSPDP